MRMVLIQKDEDLIRSPDQMGLGQIGVIVKSPGCQEHVGSVVVKSAHTCLCNRKSRLLVFIPSGLYWPFQEGEGPDLLIKIAKPGDTFKLLEDEYLEEDGRCGVRDEN